jgi:uncharacterized protein (DUF58 family)
MEAASLAEIARQVRRIEIVANRAVNDLFAGEYHSVFRGRGMEFDEVREYQPGDEIRTIDWNVTARAGAPFIKRYREERELTILFAVDVSASSAFGSGLEPRRVAIAKCAAMLMFSALKNHDKVGLLTFADAPRDFFPARKGKGAVLRLVRELLALDASSGRTNLAAALDTLNKVQKRRSVVFLFSDFLPNEPLQGEVPATSLERVLAGTASRHDLIAVRVRDRREREFGDHGLVTFEDLESGANVLLDTGSARVRDWLRARFAEDSRRIAQICRRAGVDLLPLDLPDPGRLGHGGRDPVLDEFGKGLLALFHRRERRR